MRILRVIIIIGFLVALHFYGQFFMTIGSEKKSRQIGDAAAECNLRGGMLFVEDRVNSLVFTCGTFTATIEAPVDGAECAPEREVMNELIRRDYKRTVTGL